MLLRDKYTHAYLSLCTTNEVKIDVDIASG